MLLRSGEKSARSTSGSLPQGTRWVADAARIGTWVKIAARPGDTRKYVGVEFATGLDRRFLGNALKN